MKRSLAIALFRIQAWTIKSALVSALIPYSFLIGLYSLLVDRKIPPGVFGVFKVFSLTFWDDFFEDVIERYCCRWFVLGVEEGVGNLPDYAFYDRANSIIASLDLDDAVMLNLQYGGTLSRRPRFVDKP